MPALERPTARVGIVDLTTGQAKTVPLSPETSRQYIGGRGVGASLLQDNFSVSADALGPDNVVVSAGLLGGLLAPAASVTDVVSASPAGGLAGASLGGFFGPELRWVGFDHLVILGRAPRLSWLLVHDGRIEVKDAAGLVGKSTLETQEWVRRELDDDAVQCLCIGPAGEQQVPFAGVVSGHENPAGQRGLGAVLGAKKLKAIAVRGTRGLPVAYPEKAIDYDQEMVRRIRASQSGRQLESAGTIYFDQPKGVATLADYAVGRSGCFGCQLKCRHRHVIKEGPAAGAIGETMDCTGRMAWEAVLGLESTGSVLTAGHWLGMYGLDPLVTAGLVQWAMSLYQKGILTDPTWTDGLELEAGNDEPVFELIGRIARREGLGDVLALGRARAAEKIGHGADKDSNTIIVTLNPAQVLTLATSDRRPDYVFALPDGEDGLAAAAYERSLCSMAAGILGICDLQTAVLGSDLPGFADFVEMVYLNTGAQLPAEHLRECAARAITLERLLSLQAGVAPVAPAVPELAEYYRLAGWDERGVPRPETIERLGLVTKQ